ncbi:hypothetical protein [Terrarubrum flagellatum]|uniref:L-fucose/L-arabinose isomerase family protein n=1 Tax=Terrirubrum flagellatum TaxID=2895980 RepID=UPI0031453071
MTLRIGVLPLARPTFDVPYAEEMARGAFASLDATGCEILGGRALLFDAAATETALAALKEEKLDLVLILQVTFTDATMTVKIAESLSAPLAIWAFPEPRTGGRLRLNGFCGLNLAGHALGRAGKRFGWLYAQPDAANLRGDLAAIAEGRFHEVAAPDSRVAMTAVDGERARAVLSKLKSARIGLVGEHPAGFDTCRYDAAELASLSGVSVEKIELPQLFSRAAKVADADVGRFRADAEKRLGGLDEVDQPQLAKSFQLLGAFDEIKNEQKLSALAVRCWPEMFTEFGCAACGPMGVLNERKTPCACEADMYGAVTALMLQELAGAPSYLVDVVDMDAESNTGVVWHCGSAPISMADPETPPVATIHSNRRMPLLQEFALRPGRVTVARISQAKNGRTLFIGGAEMIRAPKSFSGASGVLRFDAPTGTVAARMMGEALEHHVAIVYGDHRAPLRAIGDRLNLPVKELG